MASSILVGGLPRDASVRHLPARRSTSIRKDLMTKLRPLPFQYVWSMWHSRTDEEFALKNLAEAIPDIGAFYRVYNNFPWESLRPKDNMHFFRVGVRPLWEDSENLRGGCWTIKIRKDEGRALRVWEELCLMTCGGELQAEVALECDHVLGISYSSRLYWAHISVWTQNGENQKSVSILQQTILSRLSPELRPQAESEFYYRRHSDHEGFRDILSKQGSPGDL